MSPIDGASSTVAAGAMSSPDRSERPWTDRPAAAPALTAARRPDRAQAVGEVATLPCQLSGRRWCATAMQAPGEPKQHFPPTGSAPARIAVLGVGALGDDAVALTPAHQSAHAGRPADPSDKAHGFIVC